MLEIRIDTNASPQVDIAFVQRIGELAVRAAAMGLLPGEVITRLDAPTLRRLIGAFREQGLLGTPLDLPDALLAGAASSGSRHREPTLRLLDLLLGTIEHSPSPATEWPALRSLLGDELLGRLTGISPVSLRRYAAGERTTPQSTAERLHFLAMVVSDLAGAYNPFGIRRWFDRPRAQLDGRRPSDALAGAWTLDDLVVLKVRRLAATLSGARLFADTDTDTDTDTDARTAAVPALSSAS